MVLQLFQEDSGDSEGVIFEWELVADAPIEEIKNHITEWLTQNSAVVRKWSPQDGYIY